MENHEKATGSSSSRRALIYLRTAAPDEGEIIRQEEDCRRYLMQRNYTYTASIKDNGCSGIGRKARPGLARALEMCEAGTIEILICSRLDRLSRDPGELLELVARLKRAGIRLETVEEGDVFAHPGSLHLHQLLALYLESDGAHARTSRRRKSSKNQKGSAHSAPQTNLPLFEE
jgi:DNA invertase Pin-like site-specific DNA recombinase